MIAISTLTVSVGRGSPTDLVDVFDTDEKEQVVRFVRELFETDAARAEGWSTEDASRGFRAVHQGKEVTFTIRE